MIQRWFKKRQKYVAPVEIEREGRETYSYTDSVMGYTEEDVYGSMQDRRKYSHYYKNPEGWVVCAPISRYRILWEKRKECRE